MNQSWNFNTKSIMFIFKNITRLRRHIWNGKLWSYRNANIMTLSYLYNAIFRPSKIRLVSAIFVRLWNWPNPIIKWQQSGDREIFAKFWSRTCHKIGTERIELFSCELFSDMSFGSLLSSFKSFDEKGEKRIFNSQWSHCSFFG